jgi:hypothetical protein
MARKFYGGGIERSQRGCLFCPLGLFLFGFVYSFHIRLGMFSVADEELGEGVLAI